MQDTKTPYLPRLPTDSQKSWSVILYDVTEKARLQYSAELAGRFAFSNEECEEILKNTPVLFLNGLSEGAAEQFKKQWSAPGVKVVTSAEEFYKKKCRQIIWPEPGISDGNLFDETKPGSIRIEPYRLPFENEGVSPGSALSGLENSLHASSKVFQELSEKCDKLINKFVEGGDAAAAKTEIFYRDEKIKQLTKTAESLEEQTRILIHELEKRMNQSLSEKDKNQFLLMRLRAVETTKQKTEYLLDQKIIEWEARQKNFLDEKQQLEETLEKERQSLSSLCLSQKDLEKKLQDEKENLTRLNAEYSQAQSAWKELGLQQASKQSQLETALEAEKALLAQLGNEYAKAQSEWKSQGVRWEKVSAEQKQSFDDLNLRLMQAAQSSQEKIEALEADLADLEKTKAALEVEREKQNRATQNAQAKQMELEQEIGRLKDLSLKKELESESKISELENKQAELQKNLELERASLAQLTKEFFEAQNQTKAQNLKWEEASAEQKQAYQDLNSRYIASVEKAHTKIETLEGSLADLERAKAALEEAKKFLEGESEQQEAAIQNAAVKQNELEQEIERLKNESLKRGLEHEAAVLEHTTKQSELEGALASEKARLEQLENEYAEAQAGWSAKGIKWEELSAEQQQSYEGLKTQHAEHVEISKTNIQNLEENLAGLKKIKRELEDERERQATAIENARLKQSELEQDIGRLKDEWLKESLENEAKQSELQGLLETERVHLARLEREYSQAQAEWRDKDFDWEKTSAEQKQAHAELSAQFVQETQTSKAKIQSLEAHLDQLEKTKAALENEREKQEEALESARVKQVELGQEIERLNDEWLKQGLENETKTAEQKRLYEDLNAQYVGAVNNSETKIETLENELADLEKTKVSLEEERARQDAAIENARAKQTQLEQEIERLKDEWLNEGLAHEAKQSELMQSLEAEKTKLAGVESAFSEARQDWKEKNHNWEEASAEQKQQYEALTAKYDEAVQKSQTKIESLEANLTQLEEDKANQATTIASFQKKQSELEQEIERIKEEWLNQEIESESKRTELEKNLLNEKNKLAEVEAEFRESRQTWEELSFEQKQAYETLSSKHQAAVKAAEAKIESLEADLSSLERTKAELENERERQDTTIQTARAKQNELEQEIERLKDEWLKQGLEHEAASAEQENQKSELKGLLETEKTKLAQLENEYTQAQSEWNAKGLSWEEATEEQKQAYAELQNKFNQATRNSQSKIETLESELADLEKAKASLEEERERQDTAIENARAKQTELEQEIERLKDEWLNEGLAHEAKQAELMQSLEAEKTRLAGVEFAFSEARQDWKEKNHNWEEASAEKKQQYEALTAKHAEAVQASQEKIESLEANLTQLEEDKSNQAATIQSFQKKQNELEQEIERIKEEWLNQEIESEAKRTELEKNLLNEKNKLAEVEAEFRESRQTWEELSFEQKQAYETLTSKHHEAVESAEAKIESLEADLSGLERTKAELENERERQETTLENAQAKQNELEQEIERLKDEWLNEGLAHEAKQADLTQSLENEKTKLAQLEKEYTQAQSEWKAKGLSWEEATEEQKQAYAELQNKFNQAARNSESKIETLESELADLEKAKASLEEERARQDTAIENARAKQNELEQEIERLKDEWLNEGLAHEAKQAELMQSLEAEKTKLAGVESAFSEARQDWKEKNHNWEEASAEQNQQYEALTAKHAEAVQTSQTKIKSLEANLTQLEEDKTNQAVTIQTARAKQNELEQEIERLKDEWLKQGLEYEAASAEQESQKSELKGLLETEKTKLVQLEKEYIETQSEWKAKGLSWEEATEEQKQAYAELQTKFNQATRNSQSKIETLESELADLEKIRASLETERERQVIIIREFETKQNKLEKEIERLNEANLNQEIESEEKITELETHLLSEKNKLAEAESEYQASRQTWENLGAEQKREYDLLSAKHHNEVQAAQSKIELLENDLIALKKTNATLETERKHQASAIEAARTQQAGLDQEIERLKGEWLKQGLENEAQAAEYQAKQVEFEALLQSEKTKLAQLGKEYSKAQSEWKAKGLSWEETSEGQKKSYAELNAKFVQLTQTSQAKIEALEDDLAELKKAKVSLERESSIQEATIENSRTKERELEQEIELLKEEWLKQGLASEAILEKNQAQQAELERTLETQKARLAQLESEYAQAQSEWTEQNAKLKEASVEQKQAYENLNSRHIESLEEAEAQQAELGNQVANLEKAKAALEKERERQDLFVKSAQAKQNELETVLEAEKKKLAQLGNEYTKAQSEWKAQSQAWQKASAEQKQAQETLSVKHAEAIQVSQHKIVVLEEDLASRAKAIAGLEAAKRLMEGESEKQRAALSVAKNKQSDLEQEIERLKTENLKQDRESKTIAEEYEAKQAKLVRELEVSRARLSELNEEYEKVQREWKAQGLGWLETSTEQKERMQSLTETIEIMELTQKDLTRKADEALDKAKQEKEKFIKERATIQTQFELLREEKSREILALIEKAEALETEKEKTRGFFQDKVSEITLLRRSAESEKAKLTASLESQTKKAVEWEAKFQALTNASESERDAFKKSKDEAEAQRERNQTQIRELQELSINLQTLLEEQKNENLKWNEKYAMLKGVKGEFISALKAERKQLIESREEYAKLEKKANEYAEEILRWKKEAIELGEKIYKLGEKQPPKQDAEIQQLQQKYAQLQKTKNETEHLLELERERSKKLERNIAQLKSSQISMSGATGAERNSGTPKNTNSEKDQRNRLELILELEDQKSNSQEWKAKADELKKELNFLRDKLGN